MELVKPYFDIIQYTRISIDAAYLNSDIYKNILTVLKNKVENKCNKNGFITNVYNIVDISDGIMPPENFNGNILYDISFNCRICIPFENKIIIGSIKILESNLVICKSGPLTIFISKQNIDTDIWDENYVNKKSKYKLKLYDNIKILILDKRINQNDTQINVIGRLLDIPSEEEINDYF